MSYDAGHFSMSNLDRLRWLVLSRFGCLPGSETSKQPTDADFILCGLNMVMDMQLNEQTAKAGDNNPAFDPRRFEALKGGKA